MKLNLDFKKINIKGLPVLSKVKGNSTILLWLFLFMIVVLTGLVIYKEVRKVTSVQTDTEGILDRIVRVKLSEHEQLEKKLGEYSSFQPVSVEGADAFEAPNIPEED